MNFLSCANAFLHGLHVLTKSPSFDSHTTFKNPTKSSLINATLIDNHTCNVHYTKHKGKRHCIILPSSWGRHIVSIHLHDGWKSTIKSWYELVAYIHFHVAIHHTIFFTSCNTTYINYHTYLNPQHKTFSTFIK